MQPTIGLQSFKNSYPALIANLDTNLIKSVTSLIRIDHYDQTKLTKLFTEQVFVPFNINLKDKLRNEARSFVDIAQLHHLYNNPDSSQVCRISQNPEILQAFQNAMKDQFENVTNIAFAMEQISAEQNLPSISSSSVPVTNSVLSKATQTNAAVPSVPEKPAEPLSVPEMSSDVYNEIYYNNWNLLIDTIQSTALLENIIRHMPHYDAINYSRFITENKTAGNIGITNFLTYVQQTNKGSGFVSAMAQIPCLHDCARLFGAYTPKNSSQPAVSTPQDVPMKELPPASPEDVKHELYCDIMKNQRAVIISCLVFGKFINDLTSFMPAIQADEEFYLSLVGITDIDAASKILDWVVKKKCWNEFFAALSEIQLQNLVTLFTFE